MDQFGFSTNSQESKRLLIVDISEILPYQNSSPVLLKKGVVAFLNSPFNHWIFVADKKGSFHQFGILPKALPGDVFNIEADGFVAEDIQLGWGLGSYQFNRYKTKPQEDLAKFFVKNLEIKNVLTAIYTVRDLVNTPANDMGPFEFAQYAKDLFTGVSGVNVQVHETGKEWPSVFAVGSGSNRDSYVLEIDWSPKDPKFSLGIAGKGICFDTGGYNLKTDTGMILMKKDMAGAAQALALTKWICDENLPIKLKTIIPLAENSVSGKAYRPSDVIYTKKGVTVEVGNTDAEGRIVLCDALHALSQSNPELIIDFATLTGAARVALGTDLPAVFSNNNETARDLVAVSDKIHDPLWHMPLYHPYRETLSSKIADMNNIGNSSYAGAITAALFLNDFVSPDIPWIHIDFMGWNLTSRPARPEGGESMGMRSVFEFLKGKTI